jgi:hypothetical protein
MTSLAILYKTIFRHPRRLSAKADLEHFRAGTFHFEKDVPESVISSTLKLLFHGMLKSLEDQIYETGARISPENDELSRTRLL